MSVRALLSSISSLDSGIPYNWNWQRDRDEGGGFLEANHDALFGRRENALGDLSIEQVAKYVILLCRYGHMDVAWQLLEENAEVAERVPGLRECFRGHQNPVIRAALMQLDKLACVALHMRRYNQRGTDSDRCWPIR